MGKQKTRAIVVDKKLQRQKIVDIADNLTDLDLMAIAIHRYCWTGNAQLVNMGTVAVVEVGNEVWYAVNAMADPGDTKVLEAIQFVAKCTQPVVPYYVYLDAEEDEGDDACTHAEMKLLFQLVDEGHETEGVAIGISKPACQYCYATLVLNGMVPSWRHERQVQAWDAPMKGLVPEFGEF